MGGTSRARAGWGRALLGLVALATGLTGTASSAEAASTAYLRPNGEVSTANPWNVVGAAKAWEALDDNVDPTITPAATDAISISSGYTKTTDVALSTSTLSGLSVHGATGWFYSGTAGQVEVQVLNGSTILGGGTFAAVGWHSINVALDGSQAQLDAATMRFVSKTYGAKEVRASFLKLERPLPPR